MQELSEADKFALLPPEQREEVLKRMTPAQAKALLHEWRWWARPKQLRCFEDDWNTFVYLCGRGMGKSKTAVEWIRHKAKNNPNARIGMIGATAQVTNRTIAMDLMDACTPDEAVHKKGEAKIEFSNGATVFLWSADEPKRLRGANHHFLLCDDIIAWRRPETYDMAKLTLRKGLNPQMLVTTSAGAFPLLLDILTNKSEDEEYIEKVVSEINDTEFYKRDNLVVVRGTTFENTHLPQIVLDDYLRDYPVTSALGQAELYAKIILKVEGALFDRRWIQHYQTLDKDTGENIAEPVYINTVVAVDPAVTANKNSDYTAIVVSSLGQDGNFYVRYANRLKVSGSVWAEEVARVFHKYKANKILAEKNNGGQLIADTIHNVDHFYTSVGKNKVKNEIDGRNLPVELIHAKDGKFVRATPVAFLYETKRVWHVGTFGDLEQQMVTFRGDPNGSDDLVDALSYSILDISGARVVSPTAPAVGGPRRPSGLQLF